MDVEPLQPDMTSLKVAPTLPASDFDIEQLSTKKFVFIFSRIMYTSPYPFVKPAMKFNTFLFFPFSNFNLNGSSSAIFTTAGQSFAADESMASKQHQNSTSVSSDLLGLDLDKICSISNSVEPTSLSNHNGYLLLNFNLFDNN